MYAAVQRYRTELPTDSQEVSQIIEELVPYIRDTVSAYYVIEVGDGTFVSIIICEDEAKVEASTRVTAEWLKHYLAARIIGEESVTELSLSVDDPIQGILHVGISEPEYKRSLQLLSVQEVGELLGMGRSWVYQQIRAGEIASVQLGGGSVKVRRQDLEEYIHKHLRPSAVPPRGETEDAS
jgi:excisionase family DNA binding protein